MAIRQRNQPTEQPRQGTKPTTTRSAEQQQATKTLNHLAREEVFTLKPSALEPWLGEDEAPFGQDAKDQAPDEPDIKNEDTDLDDLDPDDPDPVLPDEREDSSDLGCGAVDDYCGAQAVVDRGDIYQLLVLPWPSDRCQCRFQAPSWSKMTRLNRPTLLDQLFEFLRYLAQWLEVEKQPFLLAPTACHFVRDERMEGNEPPVVTQQGFLRRVSSYRTREISRTGRTEGPFISEQDLSRLLKQDKVWILWPATCLPLTALFSRDLKTAWAVARCVELCPAKSWPDQFEPLSRKDKKATLGIASHSLQERLYAVSDLTGLDPKAVLKALHEGTN